MEPFLMLCLEPNYGSGLLLVGNIRCRSQCKWL